MKQFPSSLIFGIALPPGFHIGAPANATCSGSTTVVDKQIEAEKGMAVLAMSLAGVDRGNGISSGGIGPDVTSLKVRGIGAVPYATQMVNRQSVWDRTYEQFVSHTVSRIWSEACLGVARTYLAVSRIWIEIGCPLPTACSLIDLDLLKESIEEWTFGGHVVGGYYNQ